MVNVANVGEGLLDDLSKVFDPGHEIQQLRDGKIRQLVTVGSSNLLQDIVGAHVRNASGPQYFQIPVGGKARNDAIADDADFGCQFVGRPQDCTELLVGGLLLFRDIRRLHRELPENVEASGFKVFVQLTECGCPHVRESKGLALAGLDPVHCLVVVVGRLVHFHSFAQSYHTSWVVHGKLKGTGDSAHDSHANLVTEFPHVLHVLLQEAVDQLVISAQPGVGKSLTSKFLVPRLATLLGGGSLRRLFFLVQALFHPSFGLDQEDFEFHVLPTHAPQRRPLVCRPFARLQFFAQAITRRGDLSEKVKLPKAPRQVAPGVDGLLQLGILGQHELIGIVHVAGIANVGTEFSQARNVILTFETVRRVNGIVKVSVGLLGPLPWWQ